MQKTNYKGRMTKKHYDKAGIVKLYSDLQYRFADLLEKDTNVKEFEVNAKILDSYTSDFLVTFINGMKIAYDCIPDKQAILRPKYAATLDEIKSEWLMKGVEWRIVMEK
ncbi:MAG: Tn7 transposase TnsA N-terminal domain-containing protein [Lachnospiraceae bacterium]|nr:Tn7 transposase TnsA N-terminal domain-containing protein [Lachnospiraceae bacterium]